MSLIARQKEKSLLNELLKSEKAEFLALYGRRRVGKTYLIREHYQKDIYLEITGSKKSSLKHQLANFHHKFKVLNKTATLPSSWQEAFFQLEEALRKRVSKKKYVLFIDELPWLASPRSNFLSALDHFWNTYGSTDTRCVLVICGSAASWMIKHVINNKGGLHNRITRQLHLRPFNLHEFSRYLRHKKIQLTPYDQATLYMAIGGVPHYLSFLSKGKSVPQLIDALCFHEDGPLRGEFDRLYGSLFDSPENHILIIKLLARHTQGLKRSQITEKIKSLSTGGRLTTYLNELIHAGFITESAPYGKKKKDTIYRLTDEYSLFYLKWVEGASAGKSFMTLHQKPRWKAWCGYAFENLAMKHTKQIQTALGISEVHVTTHCWTEKGSSESSGAQIDLLLDRADNIINLMEAKYYNVPYAISKSYAENLRNKRALFQEATKTRKSLFLTMLTSHGLKENAYSTELIQNRLTLEDLFTPL